MMDQGECDSGVPIEFIRDLGRTTSLQEVLEVGASWSQRLVDGASASISLVAEGGEHLEIATTNPHQIYPGGTPLPFDQSLSGLAFVEQRQWHVRDLEDSDFEDAQRAVAVGLRSVIFTPLMCNGVCFGTLNVSHRTSGYFDGRSEFLRSVALLLASFIHLHEQSRVFAEVSVTDPLTGALNRAALVEEVERRAANDIPATVAFIDFNDFKAINDVHGHSAGDAVLVEFIDRVRAKIGSDGVIGRVGGDEFVVVTNGASDDGTIEALVGRLEDCDQPVQVGSGWVKPAFCIGVASQPVSETTQDLLNDSDDAMYEAKRHGLTSAIADSSLRDRASLVRVVDQQLEQAIAARELFFEYQPIISADTGAIVGAEALVRWDCAPFGLIPPETIIDRVVAGGHIAAFTSWSLDTVCAQWAAALTGNPQLNPLGLGFNVLEPQLAWSGYLHAHLDALRNHGLAPRHVVVEVVESVAIVEDEPAEATLRALAEHGVPIALDDFGSGVNALLYFTRFPIKILKVDASLTSIMHESKIAQTIVADLQGLANELGVAVVAEGIETDQQADLCRALGIRAVQGRHFSSPLPIDAFLNLASTQPNYFQN